MIQQSKLFFFGLVALSSAFVISCEPDPDDLGVQFFSDNALEGVRLNYDIVAFSRDNGDEVQADAKTLDIARLGAFDEDVFGMQKASYVTQLNLSEYNPDFGTNPIVDSAVMYLVPAYRTDMPTESTSDFEYPDGNGSTYTTTQEMTSYPVLKYGNTEINGSPAIFNIDVHEVTDFLKSTSDTVYSNASINYSTLIGTKEFKGDINKIRFIDKDDNTVLFEAASPSLRIPLDKAFFQSKIIDQQGTDNLQDLASFIRYFKGVRLSVQENDGYLFGINPDEASIVLYYSYENSSGESAKNKFVLNMGSGNAHIGQYEYDRSNSVVENKLTNSNAIDGDPKLFAQGMGGPSVLLKIPSAVIADLRDKVDQEKIGIIGAKIRLYTDEVLWDNEYDKPRSFVFLKENATSFLPESIFQLAMPDFQLIKAFDLDQSVSYYDFSVTKTIKDILENGTSNDEIVLTVDVGSFKSETIGTTSGYLNTTIPYAPERVVFVGNDGSDKRVQLQVTYAK